MKTILVLLTLAAALVLSGCASVESTVRKVPGFNFKSWAHSDRYGVFTDTVTISGARWTLNPDGSATLEVDQYDGQAAWAGTVGPHDTFSGLVVNFPPNSPQALTVAHLARATAP